MKYRIFLALLICSIMVSAVDASAQSAKTKLTDPVQAELFNDISNRLMCQCGCMMVLRVCNHVNCPSAIPMRREIERKILNGESDDEIVAAFVEEYGNVALSTPPAKGFNLAAWIMPGFAMLVGLVLIVYFFGNWTKQRKVSMAEAVDSVDDETRQRIERELKEMGE